MTDKTKERVVAAVIAIGFIAAGLILWKLIAAFLWACYHAGLTM